MFKYSCLLSAVLLAGCQTYEVQESKYLHFKRSFDSNIIIKTDRDTAKKRESGNENSSFLKSTLFAYQADIPFSNGTDESNLETIRAVNKLVKSKFIYVKEDVEDWDEHAFTVLNGKKFYGDCDDLALTGLKLAHLFGVPQSKLFRVISNATSDEDGEPNHMFAAYQTDDGQLFGFSDTFHRDVAFLTDTSKHKVHYYSRADWKGQWERYAYY